MVKPEKIHPFYPDQSFSAIYGGWDGVEIALGHSRAQEEPDGLTCLSPERARGGNMHRKSALVALCASTLTAGGVALLSAPAAAASADAPLTPSALCGVAQSAAWEACAEAAESSYSTAEVSLPLSLSEVSSVSALPQMTTVSMPVITQRVATQPVIAEPILAQPMQVSVSLQPQLLSQQSFRSQRLHSSSFAGQLNPAQFESASLSQQFQEMSLNARERVRAEANRAQARIQHHANVAKERIAREARKSERRIARAAGKHQLRMSEAAWQASGGC